MRGIGSRLGHGLGIIAAAQVPRGIHNQVVSNCTTQFFGRQSAPATIAAAQKILAASVGAAADIRKLGVGEFYFATAGSGRLAARIGGRLNPPASRTRALVRVN